MIINVSKTRSGTARLIDLVLTAIAWFVFLYLLFRGLFGSSIHQDAAPRPILPGTFDTFDTLTLYVIVAVINAAILFTWAVYNQVRFRGRERRNSAGDLTDRQLAQSYGLDGAAVDRLRSSPAAIVHHDANGNIASIDLHVGRAELAHRYA